MKKLIKVLAAAVVSVAFVGTAAGAQSAECVNTGPNSNCAITINDNRNVTLTCNSGVYAATYNEQDAESGDGEVEGNTNGGNVSTGTAVNYNGTTVTIGVTSCGPTTTPAASVTPETPGKGAAGAGATTAKPAALPYTAGNSTLAIVVGSLVAAATIVAGSRVAVAAYRHFSAK